MDPSSRQSARERSPDAVVAPKAVAGLQSEGLSADPRDADVAGASRVVTLKHVEKLVNQFVAGEKK